MKGVGVIGLFCLIAVAVADNQYTSKYDNVNIDQILGNDRLLQNYIKCLLDTGKCTPDGAELKKVLPDAIQTGCDKCSEKQRQTSRKVLVYLIENKESVFSLLEQKYDPSGQFKVKYCDLAKEEGIQVKKC